MTHMQHTQDPIERQKALEEESVYLGVTAYAKNRDRVDETSTGPGRSILRRAVEPLEKAIIAWLADAKSGKPGVRHTAVRWLEDLDPAELAVLTLTCTLNAITTRHVRAQHLATAIAKAIEDAVRYERFEQEHPELYRTLQRKVSQSLAKGRSANKTMRKVAEAAGVSSSEFAFPGTARVLIGMKLIELLIASTGLCELYLDTSHGPSRRQTVVRGTPQLMDWLEEAHKRAAEILPVRMPMLVPPRDWTNSHDGGYLTNAGGRLTLVRTRNRAFLRELDETDMPLVYEAVNLVQSTPWAINRPVLDTMLAAWDAGGGIGKLPDRDLKALPERPAGLERDPKGWKEAHPEEFKAWKRERAKVYEINAHAISKRAAASQKLKLAQKFRDERAIYFPHTLDFRGRMYPVPALLNPQGDDVARALLTFAEGKPLGAEGAKWLAIHIAGLFGIDKVSFEDRIAWVQEHSDEILDSAMSPLDGDRFWTTADGGKKAWQALAACIEWMRYTVHGDDYVCSLPISMDGSCNGLQNFSAMLRDEVGGASVNLIPQDKPADIYSDVLTLVAAKVKKDAEAGNTHAIMLDGLLTRGWTKKPVMTTPYGITRPGMRGQILEMMAEEGMEEDWDAANYLAGVISDCIAKVVVAAAQAMTWLKAAAKATTHADVAVRWTNGAGFPVLQDYRKMEGRRVKTHVLGRKVELTLAIEGKALDNRRQAQGIAPNFVHSCDAAHLALSVVLAHANGVDNFAMIHDSYGTLAADTGILAAALRHAFVELYEQDVLGQFRDELCAQLPEEAAEEVPPLPEFGSLDIHRVLDSPYFFA